MEPRLESSYRFCSQVARREARNFYPSFLLLPRERRLAMCALYAFLRHSDDIADEPAPVEQKQRVLDDWRGNLAEVVESRPPNREETKGWQGWEALEHTVRVRSIPPRYLFEVLDGVAMDLIPQPFETFDALHAYCYRVASAVGLCCLHIWGFRSEDGRAERLAVSTGLALQLTNIIRDVREDALNGRIYLPREDLDRFGVDPKTLVEPTMSPAFRQLLAFEAGRAYAYYEESAPLETLVDPLGRPVLRALVGVYHRLLHEIVRKDYDVMSRRVSVAGWRKVAILAQALTAKTRGAAEAVVAERARRS